MAADHVITLSNLTATTDPKPTDEVSRGYAVGSLWVNVSDGAGALTGHVYLLVDPTPGAAIWRQIYPGVYAGMYQEDIPTTITIGTANVDVIVDGMLQGLLHQFTFASSQLTASVAGDYKVDWSISFEMASGTGQQIEAAVFVNTARQGQTSAHRTIGNATDTGCISGTGIIAVAATDTVELRVRNETNTVNIIINHANLSLMKVGD